MANKTTVKKDSLGLYVTAGGYICRPFYGTMFKEGDVVKCHHFGGSTNAGVTFDSKEFRFDKKGMCEVWTTTFSSSEYEKKEVRSTLPEYKNLSFNQYLRKKTTWYKSYSKSLSTIYTEENEKFAKKYNK